MSSEGLAHWTCEFSFVSGPGFRVCHLVGELGREEIGMAGLLHRCVPTRCSSPAVVGFPANGSFGRRVVSVRVAPKWARLSICRASSEGGSAGVRPEEEASQERMVSVGHVPLLVWMFLRAGGSVVFSFFGCVLCCGIR